MSRFVSFCSTFVAVLAVLAGPGSATAQVRSGSFTWHAPQLTDPLHGFTSVSCASSTLCRAGDLGGRILRTDGVHWTQGSTVAPGRKVTSLTCPTAEFCAGVQILDSEHYRPITRRTGGAWDTSAPPVLGYWKGSIDCVGPAFCMLTDGQTHYLRWTGSSWTAPTPFTSTRHSAFVSCLSAADCRMVDSSGDRYRWNGTSWSGPAHIDGVHRVVALDCAAPAFCLLVTDHSYSRLRHGSWSAPRRFDDADLADVSCTSPSFCVAVDDAAGRSAGTGNR